MGTNHGGVNFGRRSPPIGGQFSTLNNNQGQGGGERVSGRQGVGGRGQDVVEDAFEVCRLFDRQRGGPVQGRPIYQEELGAHRAAGLLDVVEGLFLGFHVVEIGELLQIRPEMGRRQGTLETGPSERLGLLGPPERFQRIDPGVLARESVPGRISVVIVFGRIHSLQGVLGPSRRQEPAGNPGSGREHGTNGDARRQGVEQRRFRFEDGCPRLGR